MNAVLIVGLSLFYTGLEELMKNAHLPTSISLLVSCRGSVQHCAMRSAWSILVMITFCAVHTRRIYQGVEDRKNEYPFVVALLRVFKVRICSGTAIHQRWVLTTAHCRQAIYVQYGDMTIPRLNITKLSTIIKYLVHPNFQEYHYFPKHVRVYNDLGLLWVEKLPLTYMPLSGLDYGTIRGIPVTYVGVGVSNRSEMLSYDNTEIRQIGQGVVSSCKDVVKHLFTFPKLCVSSRCKVKQSALPGDSGGPLILDKKIVGITIAILYDLRITVFTPVSPYLTWITHTMKIHEKKG